MKGEGVPGRCCVESQTMSSWRSWRQGSEPPGTGQLGNDVDTQRLEPDTDTQLDTGHDTAARRPGVDTVQDRHTLVEGQDIRWMIGT